MQGNVLADIQAGQVYLTATALHVGLFTMEKYHV